jgi:hypothetical protein
MAEQRFEQRIGRRHPVEPTKIRWRVDRKKKKLFGKVPGPQYGVIVDLSISGAGIRAASDEDLHVGASVGIEVGGHVGAVTIRRISDADVSGESIYGVEFSNPNAKFARWLHHQLLAEVELGDRGEWTGLGPSL